MDGRQRAGSGRRLGLAAALNSGFAVVQVAVGLVIGSVVVLADAAHQAVDALGLVIAWVALFVSRRPRTDVFSYGLGKADALGGLVSGLLLVASVTWIVAESIRRLVSPEPVEGAGVIVIGVVAIVVNALGVALVGHAHDSGHPDGGAGHRDHQGAGDEHGDDRVASSRRDTAISLRAARLHLLTDLAGSVVVVVAGLVLVRTDATWVDPVASLVVSAAALASTLALLRSAGDVLLDRTPSDVVLGDVAATLVAHDEVTSVHRVHVRSLGAGGRAASAHIVVAGDLTAHRSHRLLDELSARLDDAFAITHSTLQVECAHACDDAGGR